MKLGENPKIPYPQCGRSIKGQVLALHAHCVHTHTERLGYSPKNTCHLSSSTAKQQSPHENNETAFNLVINRRYEQATQPCKAQLCKGMQDAHMYLFETAQDTEHPRIPDVVIPRGLAGGNGN